MEELTKGLISALPGVLAVVLAAIAVITVITILFKGRNTGEEEQEEESTREENPLETEITSIRKAQRERK